MSLDRLSLGEYEAFAIPSGIFGLDGGAMYGTVPKVLWEKASPADSQNRISMEARALLVKGHGRTILVDCGNGTDFIEKYGEKMGTKFAEIYGVQTGGVNLISSLAKVNLKPEDITDVFLTHLHFDHCGGGVKAENGKLVPTFPNAKYYVHELNLKNAQNPNIREKASYLSANFEPLLQAGVLQVLKGEENPLPAGMSSFLSHGHTAGQQHLKVTGGGQTLVYCGDLIPMHAHIRLAWIMGYDLHPLEIIEEKRRLLNQAADQNWHLFLEHDPITSFCQVDRNGADFKMRTS